MQAGGGQWRQHTVTHESSAAIMSSMRSMKSKLQVFLALIFCTGSVSARCARGSARPLTRPTHVLRTELDHGAVHLLQSWITELLGGRLLVLAAGPSRRHALSHGRQTAEIEPRNACTSTPAPHERRRTHLCRLFTPVLALSTSRAALLSNFVDRRRLDMTVLWLVLEQLRCHSRKLAHVPVGVSESASAGGGWTARV